ncbi:MAG: CD1871A family CXXC motif-containing protein [Clostridia bacterium]
MGSRKVRWIRTALFLTAAFFICIGITRGEAVTVLTKAVNICLECIGIG